MLTETEQLRSGCIRSVIVRGTGMGAKFRFDIESLYDVGVMVSLRVVVV